LGILGPSGVTVARPLRPETRNVFWTSNRYQRHLFWVTNHRGDSWTVDHSEITITFDNLVLTYNPSNIEHISALMDWIDTALGNETKYNYATLAVLDREQQVVWLLSQSLHKDKLSCFGHALPLPDEQTS